MRLYDHMPKILPADAKAKKLGKLPARGDPRTLMFAEFISAPKLPPSYNPWKKRTPFQPRTFGNNKEGCCTKASQALAAMRFERLETNRTPFITDAEIHRVYREGVRRHYGNDEDYGMYELDALNDFRKVETTFKDDKGHAITIDAYTFVNPRSTEEIKAAIALSGKWGMKICLNLPIAFAWIKPGRPWDVPRDSSGKPTALIGDYMPGTWGGHSLMADRYEDRITLAPTKRGLTLVHTWYEGLNLPKKQWPVDEQLITWDAVAAYSDEAYFLIDSLNYWRTLKLKRKLVDTEGIRKAVNKVSQTKIAA